MILDLVFRDGHVETRIATEVEILAFEAQCDRYYEHYGRIRMESAGKIRTLRSVSVMR